MKIGKIAMLVLAGTFFFVSCNNDDNNTNDVPLGAYDDGILVLSEGNFGGGNSAVSFISEDFLNQQNNIYSVVNGENLGDTGQDIGFMGNLAYIVMNGSNKIHVVNRFTFEHVTTISEGLVNPRYIAFANGKGYVTNWGNGGVSTDDYVAVIDLNSNTVIKNIPVAEGPERIIEEDDKLYVAHKGGYGVGSTVSVIPASTDVVATTYNVADNPNSLEVEDGILYVLCGGVQAWSPGDVPTIGSLKQINLASGNIVSYDFPLGQHPSNLVIEDDKMYYTIAEKVFTKDLSTTALPAQQLFSATAQGVYGIYSFAVEDGKIFVGDAKDYNSNGSVYVYSMTGSLLNEFTVGVTPTGIYFND